MVLIAGVDDAGRGSVIGPLVVGGVLFQQDVIHKLQMIGVSDSKTIVPKKRRKLVVQIKELAVSHLVVECSPKEIDEVVLTGQKFRRLNWLEAKMMAKVIENLKPEIAYVDASDINEHRFARHITELLSVKVKIVSEHNADKNYSIVSAASIIAKVHRDQVVSQLREKYGDFGSGYPSDIRTRQFLLKWLKKPKKKDESNFIRKSWKTIIKLQKKLSNQTNF